MTNCYFYIILQREREKQIEGERETDRGIERVCERERVREREREKERKRELRKIGTAREKKRVVKKKRYSNFREINNM